MKKHAIWLLFLFSFASCAHSQENKLIEKLLKSRKDLFGTVMAKPAKFEVQIIYTQIDRNEKNEPIFSEYTYRADKNQYFYPASTVKFPTALLALEKLNELNIEGLNKYSRMQTDSGYTQQTRVLYDSSAADFNPSIAHYIKKLLIVSDNDAYNRLYEFVGQKYLNEQLYKKGYNDLRLIHRLSVGDAGERAKYTNPITFYEDKKVVYHQPLAYSDKTYTFKLKNELKGKGFYQQEKLVNKPMNFSDKNYISLDNLHQILKAVIFPDFVPEKQRFNLTPDDYKLLYKSMCILPKESDFPNYKSDTTITDNFVKFLMYADTKKITNTNVRIFNKIGLAYGYLIDNAYIVDFKNQIEFMLSAVIYVNEDQIFNDDKYEYDTIGFPFLANLGRVIYDYELKRERKVKPNLDQYKVSD
ncbi:MAG: hypothetical protein EAZ08_07505 [Cytophagales bacterium]|nr:MAG: hypothetical protein EAZ08_07505 [Cytophagales bacterium]